MASNLAFSRRGGRDTSDNSDRLCEIRPAHPANPVSVHVVLVQPEIPPNTGNVIRLCANTGASLHLIEPLGFPLNHAKMRRAGLDYHEFAQLKIHSGWDSFIASERPRQLFAFTTKARRSLFEQEIAPNAYLVFGSETSGVPASILDFIGAPRWLRLPMLEQSRSLNLSNAVAIGVYEAWRQIGIR
jgi:tRNA (cytidine/uridine-2'-O-)-methyltransferase